MLFNQSKLHLMEALPVPKPDIGTPPTKELRQVLTSSQALEDGFVP